MKTIYNKSRIMKEANRMIRVEGLSRSIALTLAWDKARRSEFYLIVVKKEADRGAKVDSDCPIYQQSMIDYYNRGSGAYYGD